MRKPQPGEAARGQCCSAREEADGKSRGNRYTHVTRKAGRVCGDASQREDRGGRLRF